MENRVKAKFAQNKTISRFGIITKIADDNSYWLFQPIDAEGTPIGDTMAIGPPFTGELPTGDDIKVDAVVSFKCKLSIYNDKNDPTVGHSSNRYLSELHIYK